MVIKQKRDPLLEHFALWMNAWHQNVADGYLLNDKTARRVADHYWRGIDAWESAAAIYEGRDI